MLVFRSFLMLVFQYLVISLFLSLCVASCFRVLYVWCYFVMSVFLLLLGMSVFFLCYFCHVFCRFRGWFFFVSFVVSGLR